MPQATSFLGEAEIAEGGDVMIRRVGRIAAEQDLTDAASRGR